MNTATIGVRFCRNCIGPAQVHVFENYKRADVVCHTCGQGMTGWPLERVVEGWNDAQARPSRYVHAEIHPSHDAAGQQPKENQ